MAVRGKVLIVEDDRAICNFIRRVLEASGYEALIVNTGREAISMLSSHCPDVVILDLGLPDMDGMEVLQDLRRWSLMPVVVVSARTDEREKVRVLDAGADDYITKPFGVLELSARIRAALRRREVVYHPSEDLLRGQFVTLDNRNREVTADGRPVELTLKEFELLKLLMSSDRVVGREELLSSIWGYDYVGETRTLDMHIKTLRAKLGDNAEQPRFIKTVRGVGYKFIG